MNPALLIPIALEFILARASLGFPIANELIKRFHDRIVKDASGLTEINSFGAAPDELKTILTDLFTQLLGGADSIWLKLTYKLVLQFIPRIADKVWDNLFERNLVPKLAADFPPTFSGPEIEDEGDLLAACE